MSNPKVTIIMATFNRANFIVEMLQSIINQTYNNWECLIVDDGCTDNTKEVITPIVEKEKRFRYFLRPDSYLKGTSGCRNFGLDNAKGDFIIFFDDDDISHPQNLETCVEELNKGENYFCRYERNVFFGAFHYNFDNSETYSSFYIDKNDIMKMLTNDLQFNSCSVMWKKECFENERFNVRISFGDEWELYSRIISKGFKGISISKCLFYGRKHPDSITGEYYRKDQIRRESFAEAIVLVIKNLKEKKLLSYSIIRYFVVTSFNFKEFNLFKKIIETLNLSLVNRIKWKLFYSSLHVRLPFYRIKAKYKKRTKNNQISIKS